MGCSRGERASYGMQELRWERYVSSGDSGDGEKSRQVISMPGSLEVWVCDCVDELFSL